MILNVGLLPERTTDAPPLETSAQPVALVIDDSEDCQQIATYLLEQLGCRCLTAATAQEGLTLAIASVPDIILLDIVLPDFSGLELLHQFKRHIQANVATVIAVTAGSTDPQQLFNAGCIAYLSKPYLFDDFTNTLRPHLVAISQRSTQPENAIPSMALPKS